jgi:hypothetical protein
MPYSRNCPGFDPSILRHSGIWGAADETVLNIVHKKKKVFFEILNNFYLIWPFILRKSSTAPYKSWKKISSKLAVQGVKRSGILRWFQKCGEASSLAKGKKNLQKNLIFRDLENLAKNRFSEKKIFGNFLTQEFYTFLKSAQNSASFDTLHGQFWRKFFSTLIRDGAVFLEV